MKEGWVEFIYYYCCFLIDPPLDGDCTHENENNGEKQKREEKICNFANK